MTYYVSSGTLNLTKPNQTLTLSVFPDFPWLTQNSLTFPDRRNPGLQVIGEFLIEKNMKIDLNVKLIIWIFVKLTIIFL